MSTNTRRPRIGIPADVRTVEGAPMHAVGEKSLAAVAYGANATPLILPSLEDVIDIDDQLGKLDGLFFPGSPSNLAPACYGLVGDGVGPFDPQRDRTTLPLLRAAIARDMPVLAVCRGFQELNVACGGTLYAAVHEQPGYMDHREDDRLPRAQQYAPAHSVTLAEDGVLARLTGASEIWVNSLHGQGIAQLGEGLVVDATAPDGLVEAAHLPDRRFVVGVQWHPEWAFAEDTVSKALFGALGHAAAAWQAAYAA